MSVCSSERIIKIGQYFPKFCWNEKGPCFSDSQCRFWRKKLDEFLCQDHRCRSRSFSDISRSFGEFVSNSVTDSEISSLMFSFSNFDLGFIVHVNNTGENYRWTQSTGCKLHCCIVVVTYCLAGNNSYHYCRSSSSSLMRVIYHNWSAMKQRPHPQSVAEISHH